MLAHDLRAVLGRGRIALESGNAEAIPWARDAFVEALEIVENAMELADERPLRREPIAVWDLLHALASQWGVSVDASGDPVVNADATALERLLRNVVVNAAQHGSKRIRATEDGSTWSVVDPQESRSDAPRRGHGWGTRVMEQVAARHGWELTVLPTGVKVRSSLSALSPQGQD